MVTGFNRRTIRLLAARRILAWVGGVCVGVMLPGGVVAADAGGGDTIQPPVYHPGATQPATNEHKNTESNAGPRNGGGVGSGAAGKTARPGQGFMEAMRHPEGLIDKLREMAAGTDLTADEKTKIDAIHDEAIEKLGKLPAADQGENGGQARNGRIGQIRDIVRGAKDQIDQVLNDDQRKVFDQKADEARGMLMGPGMGGGPGGAGGPLGQISAAVGRMDLTDDQKTKVNAAIDTARKEIMEVVSEARQNGGQADVGMIREKMQAAMQDLKGKLQEILTPEQGEKLASELKNAGGGANARPGQQ